MYKGLDVLCGALCVVGESPLWDHERSCLFMADVHGRRMRRIDLPSGDVRDTVFSQQIGALALTGSGRIVGCMEDGLYLLTEAGGMEPLLAPVLLDGPRFNDVKAGPDGCLYGGTIHYEGKGAFYRITPKLQKTTLLTGIGNANGLDWDEARDVLYFNDTPTLRTDAFDFDAGTGAIGNRRCVRRYADTEGRPDGMTLDSGGMLWVALWGRGRVIRMDPATGRVLREIRIPASNAASCAFAGDDLRDLVITSAAHGTSLRDEPLAGAVFRIRVDTPGRLPWRFDCKEEL